MTLDNKAAGFLTTRISNKANFTFSHGILEINGNLQDVNQILADLIFVPE